jgi:uncharacterized protein YjiS (DUF1127 family)
MSSARLDASYGTLAGRTANPPMSLVPQGWLAFEQVMAWFERARQRRQLQQLGDHMLKDIGLSRADVEAEISKPFWRA